MLKSRRESSGALAASGAVLGVDAAPRAAIRFRSILPRSRRKPMSPASITAISATRSVSRRCCRTCSTTTRRTSFDTFKLKLVVVAHAAGIKFFLEDRTGTPWEKDNIDPEIYQRFVGLTKYGVEGYLCQITYKRLNIDPAKTRKDAFLRFVPSGVATVAELQAKGFAYLKVG